MREKFLSILVAICLCLGLSSCDRELENDYSLGTAGELEGRTLVVSVFVDDYNYSWNPHSETDLNSIENINSYLGIACGYLTDVASTYGKEADFIYDFTENEDLKYFTSFNCDTTESDAMYAETNMQAYIDEKIDTEGLQKKYKAENVIYFMFVNTDENSTGITCTRNYYDGIPYPYEIVFAYNVDCGVVNCPAVYAHEMLHAFGAPDLYYEDEEYGITSDFLAYVEEYMPNDIMYYCSDISTGDYVYDTITNDFSELDAYYVGLTDSCDLVEDYGLGNSQHFCL